MAALEVINGSIPTSDTRFKIIAKVAESHVPIWDQGAGLARKRKKARSTLTTKGKECAALVESKGMLVAVQTPIPVPESTELET